jgi:hypothetical protein
MTIISLLHGASDAKLAARIRADLEAEGMTIGDDGVAVVILSQQSVEDQAIQAQLVAALDANRHVVPIITQPVELPRLIDNLQPLNFSSGYNREQLLERVKRLSAPDAPSPLVTHTPRVKKANQRAGFIMAGVVAAMFLLALVGVSLGVFQAPADEFAGVETQVILTRNYYIDRYIPRNTDEALNFPATLEGVVGGSTVQPYLILTATGIVEYAEATYYPRSTDDATAFPLTLTRVSTHVQERMAATVTERAAHTPTPTPSADD